MKTKENIRHWTEDEITYVKAHAHIIPTAELSRKLECNYQQVWWLMKKLELKPKKALKHYSEKETELAIAGIGKKGEAFFTAEETGRTVASILCKRYQEKKKRKA